MTENVVHSSDGVESAAREIAFCLKTFTLSAASQKHLCDGKIIE